MKPNRLWWAMLLASQTIFLNGCTSVLWDPNTFAHSYEPDVRPRARNRRSRIGAGTPINHKRSQPTFPSLPVCFHFLCILYILDSETFMQPCPIQRRQNIRSARG